MKPGRNTLLLFGCIVLGSMVLQLHYVYRSHAYDHAADRQVVGDEELTHVVLPKDLVVNYPTLAYFYQQILADSLIYGCDMRTGGTICKVSSGCKVIMYGLTAGKLVPCCFCSF